VKFRYSLIYGSMILLLISVTMVDAQTANNLIPNNPSTNQDMVENGEALYSADLDEGTWTVVASCDSFWDMQFRIEVSLYSNMSDVLAEGQGSGDQGVSVEFSLDEPKLVYIRIEEIGGDSGFYEIGVYDDAHVGDVPTGGNSVNTEGVLFPMGTFLVIPIIIGIATVVIVGVVVFRMRTRGPTVEDIFRMQAPDNALPERYRSEPETSDIRTVRLPVTCPSCGASLTKDNIDWTGPLEAECKYCGGVLRARLEKL